VGRYWVLPGTVFGYLLSDSTVLSSFALLPTMQP
jgi:hypothetical protein